MVSSYCSAVTPGAAVKRARRLVLRASMTGAADGLVVAIDGLLRVDAPDRADLQPSTSYRVAWRARILSQKALRNVSPISTTRAAILGLPLVSPPTAGARGLETLANPPLGPPPDGDRSAPLRYAEGRPGPA